MIPKDLPQLLSPPLKNGSREISQPNLFLYLQTVRPKPIQPNDGRIHAGPRPKGSRRNAKNSLNARNGSNTDSERPILPTSRLRKDPVRDFLLDHEKDLSRARPSKQMKEDRRGEVVGNVPDDLQVGRRRSDFGERHQEDVAMNHFDPRAPPESADEVGGQLVVQLNENQSAFLLLDAPDESFGERALARSNLHHRLAWSHPGFLHDPGAHIAISQEILAQGALRSRSHE